jgi:hypothetical protein
MRLEKAVSTCRGLGKVLVLISLGYLLMLPLLIIATVPERQYYFTGVTSSTVVCVTVLLAAIGISAGFYLYQRARELVGSVS